METQAHAQLKRLAAAYLLSRGCQAVAAEVLCPISRWRLDVAGYADGEKDDGSGCEPRTVIIECKQSRGDFLRDGRDTQRLLALRDDLHRILHSVEEHRVKTHEPHLRCGGSSLFADMDSWDFASSRLESYHEVVGKLEQVEEQLHGQTKFGTIARYRLADRLYIMAPRGLVKRRELPWGWGLIECDFAGQSGAPNNSEAMAAGLTVKIESPLHVTPPQRRARLLRNIAVAATRMTLSLDGLRSSSSPGRAGG